MSAMGDNTTDWAEQAVALRRDQQMATAKIAAMFGKSASQVRKVIASANVERHVNGTGAYVREAVDSDHDPKPQGDEPQGDIEAALTAPEDPLNAFKREAGEPVGDMPKTPGPEQEGYETRLAGTRQMALDFGSEELPVGGTLKLKSDKLASGFYGLGDLIVGTFTARIVDVAGAERFQRASEEFRVQPQGHVALITEISVEVGR